MEEYRWHMRHLKVHNQREHHSSVPPDFSLRCACLQTMSWHNVMYRKQLLRLSPSTTARATVRNDTTASRLATSAFGGPPRPQLTGMSCRAGAAAGPAAHKQHIPNTRPRRVRARVAGLAPVRACRNRTTSGMMYMVAYFQPLTPKCASRARTSGDKRAGDSHSKHASPWHLGCTCVQFRFLCATQDRPPRA